MPDRQDSITRPLESQGDVKLAAPEFVRCAFVRRPGQVLEEGEPGGGPGPLAAGRFESLGDERAPQMAVQLDP